jgi:selenocysteine-specific elongation factor
MVGTAGHVDHGKTSLVMHLTGCDTDRLPEEKARGLTIDLGFAACRLSGGGVVGIVDVPGHEDFIRNMVAGAACMDVLMLVVAADDGVMPQTEEHLKIVRLLRTPRVLVVITKIDLVDDEHLNLVRDEIGGFLARAGFPDAPVLAASSRTFDGLNEVRAQLEAMVGQVVRVPDRRAFRMNVENSFSVRGHGTVVTGVPVSGRATAGDRLELLPAGRATAVRSLQAYARDVQAAPAGACAALCLRDVALEELRRGLTLAAPGVYRATTSATVWVENASTAGRLRRRDEVRFHSGTSGVLARIRLLDAEELGPGGRCFMQVTLSDPLALAAGDRFVIRSLTPVTTIGGGVILSARETRYRRETPGLAERLERALAAARAGDLLGAEMLAGPGAILDRAEVLRLTQMTGADADAAAAAKAASGELVDLGAGGWLVSARAGELAIAAEKAVVRYHQASPYVWGMEPVHVCRLLGLGGGSFERLVPFLTVGGRLAIRHGRLALADWQPAITARQIQLRETMLARLERSGVNAPARGDLVKDLGAAEPDMRVVLNLLVGEGLVNLLGSHIISASVLVDCRGKLRELFRDTETVGLPAFRKVTGLSRNLAVAMLEAFDSEGLTRRDGDGRVLVRREEESRS